MTESTKCPTCESPLSDTNADGLCPACLLKAAMQTDADSSQLETMDRPRIFDAPDPAELSKVITTVEVDELLGYGGMGAVYRGTQKNLERPVALKIIAPRLSDDPGFLERFSREAKTLGRLNHPNIVTVYDFGQAGEYCYLVMELVEGVNLRDAILSGGISPDEALAIVPKICEALQYAHNNGVVHRDIKPENILIGLKDEVKIADFGLAKMLDKTEASFTLTGTQQVLGTRNYMAPEQIERPSTVDHRADIYSLGVVFYELLTGELPLGRFSLPSEKANVTGLTDEVVLRTLEKEPARRFQQASEMQTAIEDLEVARQAMQAERPESPIPEINVHDAAPLRKRSVVSKDAVVGAMAANDAMKPEAAVDNRRQGRSERIVSLPFSNDDVHGGFSSLHGMAHLHDKYLEIEFRVHKLGVAKSNKKTVRIPYSQIAVCKLTSGVFSNSIELQATSLDVFDEMPGTNQGRLQLYFEKALKPQAKEFESAMQTRLQNKWSYESSNDAVSVSQSNPRSDDALKRSKNTTALEQITFKIHEVHSGFAEAFGIAKVTSDHLIFEYEIKDAFGVVKSPATAAWIPFEDVIAIQFGRGVVSDKISIQTNSLDSVSEIPNSTQGKFQIRTKKAQRASARAWARRALNMSGLPIPETLLESKPASLDDQKAELNRQLKGPRWALVACLVVIGLWLSVVASVSAFCFGNWSKIEKSMAADHYRKLDPNHELVVEQDKLEKLPWMSSAKLFTRATGFDPYAKHRHHQTAKFAQSLMIGVVFPFLALLVGMLVLIGVVRICRYWLVIVGCLLLLFPFSLAAFVTIPASLWLLWTLLKSDNREAYRAVQAA